MTKFSDLEERVRVLEEKLLDKDIEKLDPSTQLKVARVKELVSLSGGAVSSTEIKNDLGLSRARLSQIIKAVVRDTDYEYVINSKNRRIRYLIKRGHRFDDTPTQKHTGFVYLLRANNGLYKIGQTVNISGRVRTLNNGSSEKLILIHTIKTDNPLGAEKVLHERFNNKRTRGEWFALGEQDVKFIRSLEIIDGNTLRLLDRND